MRWMCRRRARQMEEVEALSSIYGDEWCAVDEASRIFCIKISNDTEETKLTACLQIILPPDYPSAAPPIYQINAAWLRGSERVQLANSLEDLYVEHAGESILYMWVEKIREFLLEKAQDSATVREGDPHRGGGSGRRRRAGLCGPRVERGGCATFPGTRKRMYPDVDEEVPPIKHGGCITDRRSTFQSHLAPVVAPRQVKTVLERLYDNKKIASATHNIYAYRIYCEDKNSFLQDCEDDGETAAGGRLLHLLQILDVRNVLVVVSRWYGGILLGPDRFKHINNCARSILVEEGYTASSDDVAKSAGKAKRLKGKKTK
ncbi:protein IMPACT isoform X3 [Phyllopteryx taeniolatus]|uniref:protein IMPACT isoform X3 n=1 Tax=Phyllopteryx taeniolatus TaxID=161469 RepID=UPI002AD596DA|nr:protein IMPACT isoform X3 [Phyllopteryx taeniolatus]